MMEIILKYHRLPISLKLIGNINQIDYTWKIKPVIKDLYKQDVEKLYESLYKLKEWARDKGIKMSINASFLFKSAFYFFCKDAQFRNKSIY